MEAKIISRGTGRSAVAAAAYISCSRMYNDYDGVQHDYTRKQGLVWQQVFSPDMAPAEWANRETLWNAVEETEKTKDSRLAREFVVALPVELDRDRWIALLTDFIHTNFVAKGMCADVCIHDTEGHNPHAHIMLTVRPLTKDGKWQHKTEKEYLCVRGGEERGFTAAEFKSVQAKGWEKQYQYKVGRKKVYMPPSQAEAQGLERVSKYPKSTKYGRQNPITARWNSEEQLVLWRTAWADTTNRFLERAGSQERVDHRSHAERGLDEQPTRKQGLVWQQVFLPDMAPAEWADREILWNAVEEAEKTKDSRLAREFVVALPIELDAEQWKTLLTDFIREQFVSDGMCADVCIHDTDGHNPHAHIMLTVRPLTKDGKWQQKTEKEYLCVRDDEERGFTSAEFKAAQTDGWEKQYQYRVGKKKAYMTPSAAEAQGLERASKYPKSTKYGRQNPISARWNSEEQLVLWRAAWADANNRYLEKAGREERVDHRSHAERGLDERPTIHEGVAARVMERKGIVSDRCELNRQIKADNALLRELKFLVKKLMDAVNYSISAIAESMEAVRQKMIIFRYQLLHIKSGKKQIANTLQVVRPDIKRYEDVVKQLKAAIRERRTLLEEKKSVPTIQMLRHRELAQRIVALTEDIEELKSEKTLLLNQFDCADDHDMAEIKQRVSSMESSLDKLDQQEGKYTAELDAALAQYIELQQQAEDIDIMELDTARQAIRPDKEHEVMQQLQNTYGKRFDSGVLMQSRKDVTALLNNETEIKSIREKLKQKQQQKKMQKIRTSKRTDHNR